MSPRLCPDTGKMMFDSSRDAHAYYARWRERTPRHRRPTGAQPKYCYRCPHCGAWHLTRISRDAWKRRPS